MQRIAWDMLAVKRYDLSIVIPRHISQEQDEFWVAPETSPRSLCDLPDHLLMLPRDTNYLVDVFFEVGSRLFCLLLPLFTRRKTDVLVSSCKLLLKQI